MLFEAFYDFDKVLVVSFLVWLCIMISLEILLTFFFILVGAVDILCLYSIVVEFILNNR